MGKRLTFGWRQGGEQLAGEIVGIVGDVRQRSLSADLTPHVYVAFDQWPLDEITVVMRTRGDPAAPLRAAQATVASPRPGSSRVRRVHAGDDGRPLARSAAILRTLLTCSPASRWCSRSSASRVIAYTVQQRTREIGIRIALGASRSASSEWSCAAGSCWRGRCGVRFCRRVRGVARTQNLLYGVGARDPLTFVAVAALLGGVALLASWLPARRAARVDPLDRDAGRGMSYTGQRAAVGRAASKSDAESGDARPTSSMQRTMSAVHPVWWLAPTPRPVSPWKYS